METNLTYLRNSWVPQNNSRNNSRETNFKKVMKVGSNLTILISFKPDNNISRVSRRMIIRLQSRTTQSSNKSFSMRYPKRFLRILAKLKLDLQIALISTRTQMKEKRSN